MSRYWCELAWLGGDVAAQAVVVDVIDGCIADVRRDAPCPADATRLDGLTLPGLANAHSHAFHRALRGRTHAGNGSFWTWREQMYGLAERLDPDTYHALAVAVYGEMALAGITAVGEFHYLHHGPGGVPYADPNAMSAALVEAACIAGIRITVLDACYLHGGIGVEPNAVQRRFSDGDAAGWAARVDAFRPGTTSARVGAAIHSVRAVDPASAGEVAGWARDRGVPLHAHVSEQPAENEQCLQVYGITPAMLLHEHGALDERFSAVHATHLSAIDQRLLGRNGCSICMCPTTERDLADGIGPAHALYEAGSRMTLGSDSHAVIDLFEEARCVELHERLASNERGRHDAERLLTAATADGHASLGWPGAGVIAAGAPADLVSVRLDSVRTAGASAATAVDTVVFAATAGDVHHVVADGRVIVRDGRHVSIDVPGALARTIAAATGDA